MPRPRLNSAKTVALKSKYLYEEDFEIPESVRSDFLVEGATSFLIRITKETFARTQAVTDTLLRLRNITKDSSQITSKHPHVLALTGLDGQLGVRRAESQVIAEVRQLHDTWREQAASDAAIVVLTAETALRKDVKPIPYTAEDLLPTIEDKFEWETPVAVLPEPMPDLSDQYEYRYKVIMDLLNATDDVLYVSQFFQRLDYVIMNLINRLGGTVKTDDNGFPVGSASTHGN